MSHVTKDHAIRLAVARISHGPQRDEAILYLCENPSVIRKSIGRLVISGSTDRSGLRPRTKQEIDAWANRRNK
mgnify:CR=1 FL=1